MYSSASTFHNHWGLKHSWDRTFLRCKGSCKGVKSHYSMGNLASAHQGVTLTERLGTCVSVHWASMWNTSHQLLHGSCPHASPYPSVNTRQLMPQCECTSLACFPLQLKVYMCLFFNRQIHSLACFWVICYYGNNLSQLSPFQHHPPGIILNSFSIRVFHWTLLRLFPSSLNSARDKGTISWVELQMSMAPALLHLPGCIFYEALTHKHNP